MSVPPISIALWITSILLLAAQLISSLFGFFVMDPVMSIIFFLLAQEVAKIIASSEDDSGE
jgi:Co/Zn/Cd efflux system component